MSSRASVASRGICTFAVVLLALTMGCLDKSRLNPHCEWVGDASTLAIDMRDAAQRQHLAMDVRVAGENAVRFGDSAKTRKVGLEASGRIAEECLARLDSTIMRQHHVNMSDIHVAERTRPFWIDTVLVYLPIGLLFYVVAGRMTRRIVDRRPPPGERWTMWVHLIWVGLAASALAMAIAHFHAWNIEWLRLRNGHLSFRAAYLPTSLHKWGVFIGALAIFAIATWRQYRTSGTRPVGEARRGSVNRWGQ